MDRVQILEEDRLNESCAVVGVHTFKELNILNYLYEGLSALQHRGQESVGVSVYSHGIASYYSMGLVSESTIFSNLISGTLAIGHNRYSTMGSSTLENAQPVQMKSKYGVDYAFAFNGNIRNFEELKKEYSDESIPPSDSDSILLAYLLGNELGGEPIKETFRRIATKIDGAYSVVMLIGGSNPRLVAIRDPLGFRPLCIGKNGDGYFIASESAAFTEPYMNVQFVRDVEPGEIIILNGNDIESQRVFKSNRYSHCMFEWVYFSRPDSIIDGIPVYDVREKLGKHLASDSFVDADLVIPVPDSGRGAAVGYSFISRTPLREGFQLDRYKYRRIFIMPEQSEREKKAMKKLNVIESAVNGKRVVVIDDSIVRGTNMKNMVINKLRKAGAKQIHVRISCPPLMDRCPYGVDFHRGELIASKFVGDEHLEICKQVGAELGADSVYYNTIENLLNAIDLPADKLCLRCLTGRSSEVSFKQQTPSILT